MYETIGHKPTEIQSKNWTSTDYNCAEIKNKEEEDTGAAKIGGGDYCVECLLVASLAFTLEKIRGIASCSVTDRIIKLLYEE